METFFFSQEITKVIQNQLGRINSEISAIPENQLLNSSTIDLSDYFYKKFSMTVPTLDLNNAEISDSDAKIRNQFYSGSALDYEYLNGVSFILEVPFTGTSNFFRICPNKYYLKFPRGVIESQSIKIFFECLRGESQNIEQIRKSFDEQIKEINSFLDNLKNDVKNYNEQIIKYASTKIEKRKKEVLAVKNTLANLGFKLKSDNQPKTYSMPLVQKKISIARPVASDEPYKPEPTITEEDYDSILALLDNMATVFEKSPSAFANMKEENLRCHFLVHLNAQFKGQATGETFNNKGKTDILLQVDGKSIFIAECKFWKGDKKYLETIDQLLGYLTWRDTKAVILIFNKNKNLTSVIEKITEITPSHTNYKKFIEKKSETDFRYIFASNEDRNREIYLTVKVFNIPTEFLKE